MSKGKKPRSWLTTVIVSGAALAFVLLVFLPIQRSIAKLRTELRKQQSFVRESATVQAKIAELEQRRKAASRIVEQWETHAPSERAMATFIGTVSELASHAGAETGRITPRERTRLASLVMHPAELTVAGRFHDIATFVSDLEQRPETIWMTDLTLQPTDDETTLRCKVSFTVFSDNPDNSD